MQNPYYDSLETRDPEARERALFEALPGHLKQCASKAPRLREQLAGADIDTITSRETLATLPIVRKSDLMELQQSDPPFGGLTAFDPESLLRIFASPGPIYEPQTAREDCWRLARALYAAGVRKGMLVHNAFSYHFVPAGMMLESAISRLGCSVFPAGIGQTELQVQAIERLRPDAFTGTPSFLKIILDAGVEGGSDLSSMSVGLVSGEALPPSLRADIKASGVNVLQAYATADVGLIAYESEAMEGLIMDEGVILEIVQPGTGDPVAQGEVGEIVVTVLSPDYPLLRFGTGDMSMILEGPSPCGRTNTRIKGWMGRADQTTKVRGMFVHPSQIAQIVKRFPEINKARAVVHKVAHQDQFLLKCESTDHSHVLAERVGEAVREVCKLRVDVSFESPGNLPVDGIVIEDARTYE